VSVSGWIGRAARIRGAGFTRAGDRPLLSNAVSLFGTTVLTAGLGALYWAIAARTFPPEAVGVAGAAISAMILLGRVATVGLGTFLMGELSPANKSRRGLIYSATAISGGAGALGGVLFAVAAGWIAPDLAILATPAGVFLFALGVATTAAGFVLDQAFIGLLRGGVQLLRNALASVAKVLLLVALVIVPLVALPPDGPALFATWVVAGALTMAFIFAVPRDEPKGTATSFWQLPEGLAGLALRHHALNLSVLAPSLLLPLLVTALLSAEANAYFYIAFTIANLAWAVPASFAFALYASAAHDPSAVSARLRFAWKVCIVAGVGLNAVILVAAPLVLSIFGSSYAEQGSTLLRLLALGIFPVTINSLYVSIARIERAFFRGAALMLAGMVVSFAGVALGARLGGLDGVGFGWLAGVSIGVLPLLPAVWRATRGSMRQAVPSASGPPSS
jgi:O-antigen/teichoic acid export membrane protein